MQFLENQSQITNLPPEMGTTPIPNGHIRLYHQTSPENIPSIKQNGILASKATMAEGPKMPVIWASKKPYYGMKSDLATIEFHVPEEEFADYYLRTNHVPPQQFIAIHEKWHQLAKDLIHEYPEPDHKKIEFWMSIDDKHRKATQAYIDHMKKLGKITHNL